MILAGIIEQKGLRDIPPCTLTEEKISKALFRDVPGDVDLYFDIYSDKYAYVKHPSYKFGDYYFRDTFFDRIEFILSAKFYNKDNNLKNNQGRLDNDDFLLQASVKLVEFNPDIPKNFIFSRGFFGSTNTETKSYYLYITNSNVLEFVFRDTNNNIKTISGQIPSYDYFFDFKCFQVERKGSLINLLYDGTIIGSDNIGNAIVSDIEFNSFITMGSPRDADGINYNGIHGYMKDIAMFIN